jgi:hypothetical protein
MKEVGVDGSRNGSTVTDEIAGREIARSVGEDGARRDRATRRVASNVYRGKVMCSRGRRGRIKGKGEFVDRLGRRARECEKGNDSNGHLRETACRTSQSRAKGRHSRFLSRR